MGKIKHAVVDTGPLIHLAELQQSNILHTLIGQTLTTPEVFDEVIPSQQKLYRKILLLKTLSGDGKNAAAFLVLHYELQLAEATALILAKEEKVKLFLTDDLDARTVAKRLGLEPHGTIGIIVRAYRERLLSRDEAINKVSALQETSLFITKDLIMWAIEKIRTAK
ncbi:nucleic acid-binding protein [Candidatus Woesearchaeota archaeon]|nr:nucleic acid-binding protein [Candidatus Woesearchaeota archaeon]